MYIVNLQEVNNSLQYFLKLFDPKSPFAGNTLSDQFLGTNLGNVTIQCNTYLCTVKTKVTNCL